MAVEGEAVLWHPTANRPPWGPDSGLGDGPDAAAGDPDAADAADWYGGAAAARPALGASGPPAADTVNGDRSGTAKSGNGDVPAGGAGQPSEGSSAGAAVEDEVLPEVCVGCCLLALQGLWGLSSCWGHTCGPWNMHALLLMWHV